MSISTLPMRVPTVAAVRFIERLMSSALVRCKHNQPASKRLVP
jgi:hypothetical protein